MFIFFYKCKLRNLHSFDILNLIWVGVIKSQTTPDNQSKNQKEITKKPKRNPKNQKETKKKSKRNQKEINKKFQRIRKEV